MGTIGLGLLQVFVELACPRAPRGSRARDARSGERAESQYERLNTEAREGVPRDGTRPRRRSRWRALPRDGADLPGTAFANNRRVRLVTAASSLVLAACAAGWTSTPPSVGATAPAQRVEPAEDVVVAQGLGGTAGGTLDEVGPAPEEPTGAERSRAMEARLAGLDGQAPERDGERDGFDYWDRDGDGVLTVDELTETMISAWDTNGDGVVDRAEWPG